MKLAVMGGIQIQMIGFMVPVIQVTLVDGNLKQVCGFIESVKLMVI